MKTLKLILLSPLWVFWVFMGLFSDSPEAAAEAETFRQWLERITSK